VRDGLAPIPTTLIIRFWYVEVVNPCVTFTLR
jgi:hypothetical protein